ncbi:hypothetical protein JHK87_004187 [Glycine soja]|nr:hypothetical protein JHK87_004187 [Glycine soja]
MELFIISGAACLPHPSKKAYISKPVPQKDTAPGLAYFHIPLPEYATFDSSNMSGVKQEPDGNGISSPSVNSGFFTTLLAAGDVKAVFTGHDHINDFCGNLMNIQLCYGGGFGYHAYGKAGWPRRARVVVASLEKTGKGSWGDVKSIKTWKRLDDQHLTGIDDEVLWSKSTGAYVILQVCLRNTLVLGSIPSMLLLLSPLNALVTFIRNRCFGSHQKDKGPNYHVFKSKNTKERK